MRYVMAMFTCSVAGCEERSERLVEVAWRTVKLGNGDTEAVLTMRSEVPDGWSSLPKPYTRTPVKDSQRTYCPVHGELVS